MPGHLSSAGKEAAEQSLPQGCHVACDPSVPTVPAEGSAALFLLSVKWFEELLSVFPPFPPCFPVVSLPCVLKYLMGIFQEGLGELLELKMWFQNHDVTWAGSVRSQPLPLIWLLLFAPSCSTASPSSVGYPLLLGRAGGSSYTFPSLLSSTGMGFSSLPVPLKRKGAACRCLPSPGGSAL